MPHPNAKKPTRKFHFNGPFDIKNYNFEYYSRKYNFRPRWSSWRKKPKERPRSPSSFSGTEEHTLKKIQETSDMIKKRLMMPESDEALSIPPASSEDIYSEECVNEKNTVRTSSVEKSGSYVVEEIHDKIMNHLTKLSQGRKINLICADSSGYDGFIQRIHKQKRLELSKALRDMCSNQTVANSDIINSIIPDIGIKIEDLPLEMIQELSSSLGLNLEEPLNLDGSENWFLDREAGPEKPPEVVHVKQEVMDQEGILDISKVKEEVFEEEIEASEAQKDLIPNPNDTIKHPVLNTLDKPHIRIQNKDTQTESLLPRSVEVQTEDKAENLLYINDQPSLCNLDGAIEVMLTIDKEILRLTELRQSIFLKLQNKHEKIEEARKIRKIKLKETKLNKKTTKDSHPCVIKTRNQDSRYKEVLEFEEIPEKILVMMVIQDTLLAATHAGNIICLDVRNGKISGKISVSKAPITTLQQWITSKRKQHHILVGSLDASMHEYNMLTRKRIRVTKVHHGVQCMEVAWSYVFMGTPKGHLVRYSLQQNKIEFEENISDTNVMVLKATQEGARRVLLVGLKNSPVCIRDAMSGLHLRTLTDCVTPTVYSLVMEKSLVYCGTTFHDLLVFRFQDGNLVHRYEVTNSKGIGCIKVVKNLLFASCHDGNVYVYSVSNQNYIGCIQGPGGVILSMEVVENIVIVGTMTLKFKSILIPESILEHNRI